MSCPGCQGQHQAQAEQASSVPLAARRQGRAVLLVHHQTAPVYFLRCMAFPLEEFPQSRELRCVQTPRVRMQGDDMVVHCVRRLCMANALPSAAPFHNGVQGSHVMPKYRAPPHGWRQRALRKQSSLAAHDPNAQAQPPPPHRRIEQLPRAGAQSSSSETDTALTHQ